MIIAETGAKNGRGWPTISVATSHAIVAASVACRITRAAARNRSARVRADSRERSAASSIRGCARADNVRGGSATLPHASPADPADGQKSDTSEAVAGMKGFGSRPADGTTTRRRARSRATQKGEDLMLN